MPITTFKLSAQGTSSWSFFGQDDLLQYRTDPQGNRIIDFSYAGYKGGGVPLPVIAVNQTVTAVTGDNTANIQSAIDSVAQLTLDPYGFRGAVLLAAGTYDVAGTVTISTSGVVLRGSGSGPGGTVVNLTGGPHRFLEIHSSGNWHTTGFPAALIDPYVPLGGRFVPRRQSVQLQSRRQRSHPAQSIGRLDSLHGHGHATS